MASSSWVVLALGLGGWRKRVVVDLESREVSWEVRRFWFWTGRGSLRFDQIRAVTYGYESAFSMPFQKWGAADTVDRFLVGLRPVVGDEVKLFSFLGDGGFTNNGVMPDWYHWKEFLLDYVGAQEGRSRMFVQLLSKAIGVKVEPSTLMGEDGF